MSRHLQTLFVVSLGHAWVRESQCANAVHTIVFSIGFLFLESFVVIQHFIQHCTSLEKSLNVLLVSKAFCDLCVQQTRRRIVYRCLGQCSCGLPRVHKKASWSVGLQIQHTYWLVEYFVVCIQSDIIYIWTQVLRIKSTFKGCRFDKRALTNFGSQIVVIGNTLPRFYISQKESVPVKFKLIENYPLCDSFVHVLGETQA